jgi:hypothetical protein
MKSKILLCSIFIAVFACTRASAAPADSSAPVEFRSHGNIWALTFGDYVYKANADTSGGSTPPGRGNNQYSRIPPGSRFFQFRRVYLGYTYDFSPKFTAEVLLAAENDVAPGSIGNQSTQGDVLGDNKFAPYLKLANIRWKGFFKGTDLVLGELYTPAFPLLSETTLGYRSIEKTVADMRGTPSFDEGIALQGRYGDKVNVGYDLMMGNGNGAVPETNPYPMYYGDVWMKLFDKHVIVDFYQDYKKLTWNPIDTTKTSGYHRDRNTTKVLVAYTGKKFTVGVEAMQTTLMGDVAASTLSGKTYYYTTYATAVSTYVRGRVYREKLGFFARYDNYNPSHKIDEVYNNSRVISYVPQTTAYDPTTKEQFMTFGLDFTPIKNVHLMPNFYWNTYKCSLPKKYFDLNNNATGIVGTDAVFRLTVYYIFGKNDNINY